MSLIIASNYKNTIEILSDTKLTYPKYKEESLQENNYKNGVIKLKFINKKIIIAFAGEVLFAEKAYEQVAGLTNLDEICDKILNIHNLSGKNNNNEPLTDFIIAFNSKNKCELISIKNNSITRNCQKTYIGDFDAYKLYLEYCNDGVPNINNLRGSGIKDKLSVTSSTFNLFETVKNPNTQFINKEAFIGVIDNTQIKSVGGFCVHLGTSEKSFKFLGNMYSFNPNEQIFSLNETKTLEFGNAQVGAYNANMFSSSENCVAIHIEEANLGIIFNDNNSILMNCTYYPNHSFLKFNRMIETKYKTVRALVYQNIVNPYVYLNELDTNFKANTFNEKFYFDDIKNLEKILIDNITQKYNLTIPDTIINKNYVHFDFKYVYLQLLYFKMSYYIFKKTEDDYIALAITTLKLSKDLISYNFKDYNKLILLNLINIYKRLDIMYAQNSKDSTLRLCEEFYSFFNATIYQDKSN